MSTLSQIRTKVRTDISQLDTSNTDFDDTTLNGFINEGVRYVGALVKKPTDHVSVAVEQGKEAYTLPSDAILLLDAYFGDETVSGDKRPLEILTEEALKSVNPFWLDNTSQTQGRPLRIILSDASTVVINPKPDSTNAGKELLVNYCYQPAILSADSDVPTIPIVFHDLIAKFAVHLCYMGKLGKPDVGLGILNSLENMAKKLENLATKEQLNLGFYWATSIDDSDSLLDSYR